MQRIRALASHPLAGPGFRFGITGATVAGVYIGVPVVLNGGAGVPIQVAIPFAYLLAISLHFTLQRHFVFRHVSQFALTRRAQIGRYIAIGSVQYPATAIATALLPGLIGLSARTTFVLWSLTTSAISFLVLRAHIFHPTEDRDHPPATASRAKREVG